MRIVKEIKLWLAPAIMALIALKAVVLGIGFPEAFIFAFVSAIFGVEKYYYLHRLHKLDQRKSQSVQKELSELKNAIGMTRLQQSRTPSPTIGRMGDIPWGNKSS